MRVAPSQGPLREALEDGEAFGIAGHPRIDEGLNGSRDTTEHLESAWRSVSVPEDLAAAAEHPRRRVVGAAEQHAGDLGRHTERAREPLRPRLPADDDPKRLFLTGVPPAA